MTETRSPRRIAQDEKYAAQVAEVNAQYRTLVDGLTEAQGGEQEMRRSGWANWDGVGKN